MAISFNTSLGILFSDGTAQNSVPNTFGISQSWTTQTYSAGSVFTNSSSLPILINYRCPMPDNSQYYFYVNNVLICTIQDTNYGNTQSVLIFVPVNATYKYSYSGTGSSTVTGYRLQ